MRLSILAGLVAITFSGLCTSQTCFAQGPMPQTREHILLSRQAISAANEVYTILEMFEAMAEADDEAETYRFTWTLLTSSQSPYGDDDVELVLEELRDFEIRVEDAERLIELLRNDRQTERGRHHILILVTDGRPIE